MGMHILETNLFLVVELDVPLEEECPAELLYLEGDVERDGDDVVEEHQERKHVVEHLLRTAAWRGGINHNIAGGLLKFELNLTIGRQLVICDLDL